MRIVIDLQAAQTTSARRGIGRYSLALARNMVRQAGEHEFILALNSSMPDSIEPVRAAFDGLLDQANIRVWDGLDDVAGMDPTKRWRRQASERLRESFLASLNPDAVHVASLFEGQGEDAATSLGVFCPSLTTAVTVYDLIPLMYREFYLRDAPVAEWYETKVAYLKRADHLLAISEATRREVIELLDIPADRITNISAAVDERFTPRNISPEAEDRLRRQFGLQHSFVMSAGTTEHRKNIEGLIRAFALLPDELRRQHQLLLVSDVQEDERRRLDELARHSGLNSSEVVYTGFVSDDDLVALYNMCEAFVFPSLHEGFGLPLAEAMACGAAAIAADSSSLPEVLGRADALFAPADDDAMAARLRQVLSDEAFRADLRSYGPKRAARFSWEASARRALEALEACSARALPDEPALRTPRHPRPRLIFVSPMPPAHSGIADYSVELLHELTDYYDIDIVVSQDEVARTSLGDTCSVRTLDWFNRQASAGDRIVYQFGNSSFHSHMFAMVEQRPGLVVLHDFFLGNIIAHREYPLGEANVWSAALYHSHGYRALAERFTGEKPDDTIWKYPANLSILQLATGVIVHSNSAREMAREWFGDAMPQDWVIVPQPRAAVRRTDREDARKKLRLRPVDYVVCSFGVLGAHKNSHRLLDAWLASRLASDKRCRLLFVGENADNAYNRALSDKLRASGTPDNMQIMGFVTPELYQQWLAAADLAVQLRASSRGETSRAVLDCMSYGLPTIVNRHGAMAELPADALLMIDDQFLDEDLARLLERSYADSSGRQTVGQRAREIVEDIHSPRKVASLYFDAIERFHEKARRGRAGLITSIVNLDSSTTSEHEWLEVAQSIAHSFPLAAPERQLLVDVSALAETDLRTGIQRVVRNVLKYLLDHPPAGFRVEPVYATGSARYRYARRWTLRLLGCPDGVLDDDLIDARAQDVFLGLDLHPVMVKTHAATLARMRDSGVKVYFTVYDLLWTRIPQHFFDWVSEQLDQWLEVVMAVSDGAICISRTVADELYDYITAHPSKRVRGFDIGWFHLGADMLTEFGNSPTNGAPKALTKVLAVRSPFILMVGTIEPRKGYELALSAFEALWNKSVDVSLVIAGKEGWMVESLMSKLCSHPELGRRLFWLPQSDDQTLSRLYETASGLLMASEGEGFGLPLIEAVHHGCPILSRELPVFREVAQEHATYFRAANGVELADALVNWLAMLQNGTAPQSAGIPIKTWAESAEQLLSVILGGNWYRQFDPKAVDTARLTTVSLSPNHLEDANESDPKQPQQRA
jgi:glycosyltransferase involved in cell wall biosynthesis